MNREVFQPRRDGMIFRDDDDRDFHVMLVARLFRDSPGFVRVRLRVAATDDFFVLRPIGIRNERVMQHHQSRALVEKRKELRLLIFGDVLQHIVQHDHVVAR